MSPKRPADPMLDAPADAAVPPMPAEQPAAVAYAPPHATGPWRTVERDPKEALRKAGLALAMVFLAISLAIAYYSANRILDIWFEYQWTPIVRLVMALGIAGLALWIILRLTQKK